MTAPILIYGAGGFAREVLQVIVDINSIKPTWRPVGFYVDPHIDASERIRDLPVIKDPDWINTHQEVSLVLAVGSSAGRHQIASRLLQSRPRAFATLVHPRSWIGARVTIGPGTIVCAGALITTDITIGSHVHINIGCTIGHDALIEDYVTLNPSVNISGNVTLREGCDVGTGSIAIPHVQVGGWSVVGAGTVLIKSMEANSTIVGSPGRVLKTRSPNWHLN